MPPSSPPATSPRRRCRPSQGPAHHHQSLGARSPRPPRGGGDDRRDWDVADRRRRGAHGLPAGTERAHDRTLAPRRASAHEPAGIARAGAVAEPADRVDVPGGGQILPRAYIKRMIAEGYDWRDAIDGIRPCVPAFWKCLTVGDRGRFVAEMARDWDVVATASPPTRTSSWSGCARPGGSSSPPPASSPPSRGSETSR